ncbi:MAG: elongation factor G [Lachnospiraceae bacterium]|jgi:elongation factor G
MNVFKTDAIRNVVLLGHGGSGKTTLVEAIAHLTGITKRMGNVADGNTVSDFDKEEIKRKFSISTSIFPAEWKGTKINFLDAPGYFDFVGEAYEAASAADGAIIVVSAKDGIQVGTVKAWELCEKFNLPCMFFISGLDVPDVDYESVLSSLVDKFGAKVAPLSLPIFEGGKLTGYVNIVKKGGRRWIDDKGKKEVIDIPADMNDALDTYYNSLLEAVAETSEEYMDRFFEGDEFTSEEIIGALESSVAEGDMVPVCIGSAAEVKGLGNLMDNILDFFNAPSKRPLKGTNVKTGEEFAADYDPSKEKSAYVWKTMVDPFIGKYSLIKVTSGVITPEDTLYNADKGSEERLNKLYVMVGNKPQEVPQLCAGDIGALAKMNSVSTGDTLSTKATPVAFEKTALPKPYTYKRYKAVKKGDEDKIAQSLAKMMAEDLTIKSVIDSANHQSLLYGMGEQHLDIVVSKLKERYKIDVELVEPRVAFKETIRKESDVQGKYKKQSGGHGQFGDVRMRFSPSGNLDEAFEFTQEVVGGSVPKNFFPAVEKGLAECVLKGPLAAYPVVGVKAVLYDGSYHPVDSSEQAFKSATRLAFKDGFMKASPVLLEPIVSVKVVVPNDFTGDVMGDLNKRRGRVLGMNPDNKGNTIVEADVPELEMYGYGTQLRSMTGGAGDYSFEFARYEQAPSDIQEKQIELRKNELSEEE